MILKRLKEFIDNKGIPVSTFEKSIGMSNASFGKSLKNNGTIGADKLEIILNVYPDINLEWLILGKGSMFGVSDLKEGNIYKELLYERESKIEKLNREIGCLQKEVELLKKNNQSTGYPMAAEPELGFGQKKGKK